MAEPKVKVLLLSKSGGETVFDCGLYSDALTPEPRLPTFLLIDLPRKARSQYRLRQGTDRELLPIYEEQ